MAPCTSTLSHDDELVMLEQARQRHHEWKDKLLAAVDAMEPIDADTISRDDLCKLGSWLCTDGDRCYGSRPAFQDLVLHHREFHLLVGAVAEIVNKKQYGLAKAYLSDDAELALSSSGVEDAIQRLTIDLAS